MKIDKSKLISAVLLIFLGILFRTVLHVGDNIEFVTTAALLSGAYLGMGWSIGVPVISMVISDLIIGNSNIFIFTWSAYMIIGISGFLLQKFKIKSQKLMIARATGLGVLSAVFFFLWTNFGVWLLDSFGMYPKTIEGLMNAFLLGLPFLQLNLIGNLIFIPVSFFLFDYAFAQKLFKVKGKSAPLVKIRKIQ